MRFGTADQGLISMKQDISGFFTYGISRYLDPPGVGETYIVIGNRLCSQVVKLSLSIDENNHDSTL